MWWEGREPWCVNYSDADDDRVELAFAVASGRGLSFGQTSSRLRLPGNLAWDAYVCE